MEFSEDVQMERLPDVAHSSAIEAPTSFVATNKDCVYTFSDNCDSDEGEELKYKIKNIVQSPPCDDVGQRFETPRVLAIAERHTSNECTDAGGGGPNSNDNGILPSAVAANDGVDALHFPNSLQSYETSSLLLHAALETEPAETLPSAALPVRPRRTTLPNGITPMSGKPLTFASNVDRKATAAPRVRSKPKRKALVAMYQSQISDNKIGIKLKLKKSDALVAPQPPTPKAAAATKLTTKSKKTTKSATRKRTKRGRARHSSEDDDYSSGDELKGDKRVRRTTQVNNNAEEPDEQSRWGEELPFHILVQIFGDAIRHDGSLPTLLRVGRVCATWREAAMSRSLWQSLDLTRWTKEKSRTEWFLKWFIENRLSAACTDINLGELWEFLILF